MSDELEEYINNGIYGARETKRAERRQYLGTLRERVLLALSKGQVRKQEGLKELEKELQSKDAAELLLNGELSYRFLTDYKKLANKYGVEYTTISDLEVETDLGIVLTADYAVEKEDIFLPSVQTANQKESSQSDRKSTPILSKLKSIFKSKP